MDSKNITNSNNIMDKIFFVSVISLSIVQQMPVVNENYYGILRLILYVMFSTYGLISILRTNFFLQVPFVRYFMIVFIYSILLSLIARTDTFELYLIPMGVLIASVNARLEISFIRKLVDWFILLVTFLSVSSILYYVNGFTISATYLIPAKNQIGPMISIAILLSLFTLINKDFLIKKRKNNLFYSVCFLLTFTSLLTIRNRSGILAIAFCVLLYFLKRIKFKYKLKTWGLIYLTICIILGLLYFGYFDRVIDYIWDSFTLNYDVTNIDMLSAGRFDTYIEGIAFAFENPVFGEMGNNTFFRGTPHNYIIANIVRYGLVFGMPLIVFYLYLWWFTIKNTLFGLKNAMQIEFIWILFATLIVSFFEYSYPYGPGTSQLMMWILLGYYLRSKNIEKKNK